jgi:hypothetical protein
MIDRRPLTGGQQKLLEGLQRERDAERQARRLAEHRARAAEAKATRVMRLLALAKDSAKT